MSTVNSAVSDPTLFSALTWIWPASFEVTFLTVNVDWLSLVSTLAAVTGSPACVQTTFGVGVPLTLTEMVNVDPALSFTADLYLSSYVIAGLPASYSKSTSQNGHNKPADCTYRRGVKGHGPQQPGTAAHSGRASQRS